MPPKSTRQQLRTRLSSTLLRFEEMRLETFSRLSPVLISVGAQVRPTPKQTNESPLEVQKTMFSDRFGDTDEHIETHRENPRSFLLFCSTNLQHSTDQRLNTSIQSLSGRDSIVTHQSGIRRSRLGSFLTRTARLEQQAHKLCSADNQQENESAKQDAESIRAYQSRGVQQLYQDRCCC